MLGTNAVFHTTEDTFPQGETGQQLSFTGDGSLGERLSRVLLHSTLKQTPGATALHWQSLWKRRALVAFLPSAASPDCTENHMTLTCRS